MILTEDKLVDWVESQNGLLITRRTLNINNFDVNSHNNLGNRFVCITGYPHIISDFFLNIINYFSDSVIVIIIESDIIELKEVWLNNIKIKHCFTWNKPFHHPKLSGIPIGLNYNRQYNQLMNWLNNNNNNDIFDNINKINHEPKNLLCMNYSPQTNPERSMLINKSNNEWSSFCKILDFIPNLDSYYIPSHMDSQIRIDVTNPECYNQWKNYKFVLSPPGTGIDCHRTWEAISVGCIPIVISSNLNELYEDLPILIVNSWDEINEEYLNQQYNIISTNIVENKYNYSKLTLEYWVDKINDTSKYLPKIHFITYGDKRFSNSKKRLVIEAKEFSEFASIRSYGPEDLPLEFVNNYKNILEQQRGGGYWIWRPIILNDALKYINANDYLVYLDAGCKLNKEGKERFYEYISLLNNSEYGILSFQMSGNKGPGTLAPEKVWTTKEIFEYFEIDVDNDLENNIANSGQYLGGVLILKKNEHLKKYMERYIHTILENPLLCTDFYNHNNRQISEFSDNRHEQSISSILRKIYGSVVIDGDETWMVPFGEGESIKYPFWALRLKT